MNVSIVLFLIFFFHSHGEKVVNMCACMYSIIALAACGMLGANDLLVRKNSYGCCPHGAYSLVEVSSLNNHTYNHWYKQMSNHWGWGWGWKKSWCYGETKFGVGSFGSVSLMKWTLPWEVKEAELIGKEEREEHCRQKEQQVQRFLTRESSVIPRSWEEAWVAIGENDGDSWAWDGRNSPWETFQQG